MHQTIRFVTTTDGTRLAWATAGSGPPLVRAATWLTHLEHDWDSPVWRHWLRFLAGHFRLLRYDERGCGLSSWDARDVSWTNWVPDLETVIEAARPERPFALLGVSQGAATAIAYAVAHPEHVSHLIICGGYPRGWECRGDPDEMRRRRAVIDLVETGWGQRNPVFRQLFTSHFIPDGSDEQLRWFNELCARTTTPAIAARLMRARGEVDVLHLLPRVEVPTLVLHARRDAVVPHCEGQRIAAGIPGAEYVELDSPNHILLEHEPAWARFMDAVAAFTGAAEAASEDGVFGQLSPRERDILAGIVKGMTNADIGRALFISEKTVRNHLTRIYEKLGVATRAQAMVLARERRFQDA